MGRAGPKNFRKTLQIHMFFKFFYFFVLLCPFVRETKNNVNKCHENVVKKYKTFNNSLNINAKEPRFFV